MSHEISLIEVCQAIVRREMRLAGHQFSAVINPLLFFILVVTLFPLSLPIENHLLHQIAPELFGQLLY